MQPPASGPADFAYSSLLQVSQELRGGSHQFTPKEIHEYWEKEMKVLGDAPPPPDMQGTQEELRVDPEDNVAYTFSQLEDKLRRRDPSSVQQKKSKEEEKKVAKKTAALMDAGRTRKADRHISSLRRHRAGLKAQEAKTGTTRKGAVTKETKEARMVQGRRREEALGGTLAAANLKTSAEMAVEFDRRVASWSSRVAQAHLAGRTARTEKRAAALAAYRKDWKTWSSEHAAKKRKAKDAAAEFEEFVEQQKVSGDACSAKLHQSGKKLSMIHREVDRISEEISGHEEVIATESENLNTTEASIAEARLVLEEELEICVTEKTELRSLQTQYTMELKELEEIANPQVRASVVEAGLLQTAGALHAETAPKERKKAAQPAVTTPWTASQCLHFLQWSANASFVKEKRKQQKASLKKKSAAALLLIPGAAAAPDSAVDDVPRDETEAAGAEEAAPSQALLHQDDQMLKQGDTENTTTTTQQQHMDEDVAAADSATEAPAPADCDTDKELLQTQFTSSVTELKKVLAEVTTEIHSTVCETTAKSNFDISTVDLFAAREQATTKVEAAGSSIANLEPSLEHIELLFEKSEKHVELLQKECEGGSEVSDYLKVVRELIVSTADCPDMDKLKLVLPGGGDKVADDEVVIPLLSSSIVAMAPMAPAESPAAESNGECYGGMLWTKAESGYMKVDDGAGKFQSYVAPCEAGIGKSHPCVAGEPEGAEKYDGYASYSGKVEEHAFEGCCHAALHHGCTVLESYRRQSAYWHDWDFNCPAGWGLCQNPTHPEPHVRELIERGHYGGSVCKVPIKGFKYYGYTVEKCKEACAADPNCAAIEYGKREQADADGDVDAKWADREQCVFKQYTKSGMVWKTLDGEIDAKRGHLESEELTVEVVESAGIQIYNKIEPKEC